MRDIFKNFGKFNAQIIFKLFERNIKSISLNLIQIYHFRHFDRELLSIIKRLTYEHIDMGVELSLYGT